MILERFCRHRDLLFRSSSLVSREA